MKYGYAVKKNGILYAPGMEVPGDSPVSAEVTDDVPDGALNTNADDAEGSADESQQNQDETDDKKDDVSTDSEKQEDDGTPAQEQDKSKCGRKSKEE